MLDIGLKMKKEEERERGVKWRKSGRVEKIAGVEGREGNTFLRFVPDCCRVDTSGALDQADNIHSFVTFFLVRTFLLSSRLLTIALLAPPSPLDHTSSCSSSSWVFVSPHYQTQ